MHRGSIIVSAAFHVIMVIIAIFGLPFLAQKDFIIPQPVVIDFIDVAKVSQTTKVAPKPVKKEKEQEKPKPAAKNTAEQAVSPVEKPKPKEKVKDEVKKAQPKNAVVADENALPNKDKKAVAKPVEEKDFSSVLKNLVAQEETPESDPELAQNAPLGEKMTMSEQDALRSQLEKCWNVPFGAKDVESISVDILLIINADRTLREAKVVDKMRYNSDTFYRAVADSALRAVRSSQCSPFSVPEDKYDVWNRTTVTFNPKDMF